MRILVIGANGQLGSDIVKVLHSKEVVPLTHKDIEIAEEESVKEAIRIHNPQVVIIK
jgi:dTDP-4-dehydrorhamnose reductase